MTQWIKPIPIIKLNFIKLFSIQRFSEISAKLSWSWICYSFIAMHRFSMDIISPTDSIFTQRLEQYIRAILDVSIHPSHIDPTDTGVRTAPGYRSWWWLYRGISCTLTGVSENKMNIYNSPSPHWASKTFGCQSVIHAPLLLPVCRSLRLPRRRRHRCRLRLYRWSHYRWAYLAVAGPQPIGIMYMMVFAWALCELK